jgi:hypothetical protein
MRKSRFPKAAYVRRLEQLYADLSWWRDEYHSRAKGDWFERRRHGFMDRQNELGEVQRHVLDALYSLDNLARLS